MAAPAHTKETGKPRAESLARGMVKGGGTGAVAAQHSYLYLHTYTYIYTYTYIALPLRSACTYPYIYTYTALAPALAQHLQRLLLAARVIRVLVRVLTLIFYTLMLILTQRLLLLNQNSTLLRILPSHLPSRNACSACSSLSAASRVVPSSAAVTSAR